MGEILFAGEEPQEGAAALRDVVADRAAELGVAGFEGVEDRALRDEAADVELHFGADVGQCLQVIREDDADHGLGVGALEPAALARDGVET